MAKSFHFLKEDYFPFLIKSFKTAIVALEYLVDDLHTCKELTINRFLRHPGSEDFLWGIVKLMSNENLRVSGNSAYVFGTLAENDIGIERIIGLLNNKSHPDSQNILLYLVNLLKSTDFECLMNAAGTIGTISENSDGREWLINHSLFNEVIELSTSLLDNKNNWVSSNAALVIARITIEEIGCKKLLNLSSNSSLKILDKLVDSLGCDNAGRGMNCAFAIGRLCDDEKRRLVVLKIANTKKLIQSLSLMIEKNGENGCTKNACFALSCMAANAETNQMIVEHKCFCDLLNILCKILLTVNDAETQWFAAMLLRIFSGFPLGCLKLKNTDIIWDTLNDLIKKEDLYVDVKEEILLTLDALKPLEKPSSIKLEVRGCNEIFCKWDEIKLKNNFIVHYLLLKNDECVYKGPNTEFLACGLKPFSNYSFRLQFVTIENGEKSEMSEATEASTEESTPSEPTNLKVMGVTTTVIRIAWDPPLEMNGTFKHYYIYKDNTLIDQINDTSFILGGLHPGITYEFQICASTSKGKGERATIRAATCDIGDLMPEKPTFGLIGRREILVRWGPPKVLSKLNRYELIMNGKCIYSGINQEHQVSMLKPDTEYKFEIIAITSDGKCKSKVSKIRTLKDEYDPDRLPLYPGSNISHLSKEKTEISFKKTPSKELVKKPSLETRQKTRMRLKKGSASTIVTNPDDSEINEITSKKFETIETNSQSLFFPPVTISNESSRIYLCQEDSNLANQSLKLYRPNEKNTSRNFNRSKTLISFNQSRQNLNESINIQPTTITLNLHDIPIPHTFPILPLVNNTSSLVSNHHNEKNSLQSKQRFIPNYSLYKNTALTEKITPIFRSNTIVNSYEFSNFITKFK